MKDIMTSVLLITVFTVVLGIGYPLAVWGVSQAVFPYQANGSLIIKNGKNIGSELIGQQFESDKYFHGRISANSYDGANSGGSNLGPTSQKLIERINADAEKLGENVPVELITSSASGLDPDISPESAMFQVERIAQTRGISEDKVRQIVARNIETRQYGIFGEPRLNVLKLNLELDK